MRKTVINLEKVLLLVLFGLSLFLICIHLFSNILGFYYTGDTISAFETSIVGRAGNLLTVFVFYYPVWPPGMGFIYSILRVLPVDYLLQHHIYVLSIFSATSAILYLISLQLSDSRILRVIIFALALFGGVQGFIFHTALSDSLFVFFWLSCLLFAHKFFVDQKERYLLLFGISAIGLTLSRYSGISVLISLLSMILFFAIKNYRAKKFSPALVILVFINVWIPIGIYLLRNRIIDNRLFGLHDKQFPHITFFDTASNLSILIFQDISVLIPVCLFIGVKLQWGKNLKYISLLSGISALFYLGFLYLGFFNYRIQDGFRSRLAGISYPELAICAFGLGAFISYKFPRFRKLAIVGLVLGVLYLGNQSFIEIHKLFKESVASKSEVLGTEYSQDIKNLCKEGLNKYLLIQPSSRNWTAQSLRFYCEPIDVLDIKDLPKLFTEESYIYSAYKLSNPVLSLVNMHDGVKKVFIYKVDPNTIVSVTQDLEVLTPLD